MSEALERKEGIAIAYSNLGIVYRIRGDLDQAEAMYRKSLILFQEIHAASQVKYVQGLLHALRVQGSP
jgi:protein O-GlcNAc transferase